MDALLTSLQIEIHYHQAVLLLVVTNQQEIPPVKYPLLDRASEEELSWDVGSLRLSYGYKEANLFRLV